MKKDKSKLKALMRVRRHRRIRGRVRGTAERPRLSLFRSLAKTTLQLVDDEARRTIAAASSSSAKKRAGKAKRTKTELAQEAGRELAKKALAKGIKQIVFDRGGYAYHGRVRAAAEGAREGGLEF